MWGRVRTAHSVSAANVFPVAGPYSGLVVADNHNLLNMTGEEVADMFLTDVIRKGKLRKHMGLLPTFRENWAVLQPRLLTLYSSSREKEVLLHVKLDSRNDLFWDFRSNLFQD